MTTVAQMIAWMQTLPQDAEVECLEERQRGYVTYTVNSPVNIEKCAALTYSEEFFKSDPIYGKTIVYIRAS